MLKSEQYQKAADEATQLPAKRALQMLADEALRLEKSNPEGINQYSGGGGGSKGTGKGDQRLATAAQNHREKATNARQTGDRELAQHHTGAALALEHASSKGVEHAQAFASSGRLSGSSQSGYRAGANEASRLVKS